MKESLQITLRKNRRSEDLIQIARKIQGEKITYSYGQSQTSMPVDEIFTTAEEFEIGWFDQIVKFFHEHLDSDATELERYRLFLPEKFYNAMFELYEKCKKNKIDYKPMDSILKSIINKIQITEKKLAEKTGIISNVLQGINFSESTDRVADVDSEIPQLFKILIECPNFHSCFQEIAINKFGKQPKIKPGHFKGYAQGHTKPSRWVCACAIDIISRYQNPFDLLSKPALIELWAKPIMRATLEPNKFIANLQTFNAGNDFIASVRDLGVKCL